MASTPEETAPVEQNGDAPAPAAAKDEAAAQGANSEGQDPAEEGERAERVVVKFLMPNVAAGSIIGKGGSNISEIQTQSSARMQLSKANEFYPGSSSESQDRILLISGTVNQLLTALHLVLSRLRAEPGALRSVQAKDSEAIQLRMLVHSRLCGTLIGKGGATIRSFNEDSKATFNISPPPTAPGLTERVVKITGEVDHLMRAVALVVTKLSENPDYHLLTDANLSYTTRGAGFAPVLLAGAGGYGHGGGHADPHAGLHAGHHGQAPYHHDPHPAAAPGAGRPATSITMGVPEDRVGVVIGKGGQVINQIKELMGVSIRISKKGEFLPGTADRSCTISGDPAACELARQFIQNKVDMGPA
eukprot:scaffold3.g6419.t1